MKVYLLLILLSLGAAAQTANVVKYRATIDEVKYVYSPAAPVAHVKPGDIIETNTLRCIRQRPEKARRQAEQRQKRQPAHRTVLCGWRAAGGHVGGEDPRFTGRRESGCGSIRAGLWCVERNRLHSLLHPPLPEKIWFYPIDKASNTAMFKALDSNFSVKIPLHPFFGCIGVAPAGGEVRSSIVPAEFGGNMDAPEASVGNIVYLPVNVPGALLYIGDGHAAMGDGEVAGTAIEVPLLARLQVSIIKGKRINWPRFENDNSIMTVGAYRPLDDALRIVFTELVDWIHKDYGLSSLDAYELLSKVAKIHLDEMVDPNYVVVASIDKRFLPAKKK
jgi:amidase